VEVLEKRTCDAHSFHEKESGKTNDIKFCAFSFLGSYDVSFDRTFPAKENYNKLKLRNIRYDVKSFGDRGVTTPNRRSSALNAFRRGICNNSNEDHLNAANPSVSHNIITRKCVNRKGHDYDDGGYM
jgi:hypothetical protein